MTKEKGKTTNRTTQRRGLIRKLLKEMAIDAAVFRDQLMKTYGTQTLAALTAWQTKYVLDDLLDEAIRRGLIQPPEKKKPDIQTLPLMAAKYQLFEIDRLWGFLSRVAHGKGRDQGLRKFIYLAVQVSDKRFLTYEKANDIIATMKDLLELSESFEQVGNQQA